MTEKKNTFTEEIHATADQLIGTIKDLLHEGNVRHLVIKNPEGQTVIEVPVNVGVISLLVAPILAAIGAIAVFAAKFTIVVTREKMDDPIPTEPLMPDPS